MKIAERIVIVLLLLALIGGAAWIYFSLKHSQKELREAVARGDFEIRVDESDVAAEATTTDGKPDLSDWRVYYPVTVPLSIGSTSVHASVADSLAERIKGLSDTPYLPEGLVKLFVFGAEGEHSIWMKDMQYALDILWVTKAGKVVYIEEDVSPDSYPESFSSPVSAWYVIEAPAGFVEKSAVKVGDEVVVHAE